MGRPQTYDHLRSQKKPTIQKVVIALDSEIADEFEEAKAEKERAEDRLSIRPEDPKLQATFDQAEARYKEALAAVTDNSVEFVLKSVGRRRFEDLVLSHPATPEQQEESKARTGMSYQWNPDTFPTALLALSIVSPPMTEADVKDMMQSDDWSSAEINDLVSTAILLNENRRIVNLGKG